MALGWQTKKLLNTHLLNYNCVNSSIILFAFYSFMFGFSIHQADQLTFLESWFVSIYNTITQLIVFYDCTRAVIGAAAATLYPLWPQSSQLAIYYGSWVLLCIVAGLIGIFISKYNSTCVITSDVAKNEPHLLSLSLLCF